MKLLNGARQSGKTLALLEYCRTHGSVIVCPNDNVMKIVHNTIIDLGYTMIVPVTVTQYMQYKNAPQLYLRVVKIRGTEYLELTPDRTIIEFIGTFCFEELEQCLHQLGIDIDVATGTIPTLHPHQYLMSGTVDKKDPTEVSRVLGVWDLCQR